MIKIYHNPKCSKSREGICFLDALKEPYEIIKYIDIAFKKNDLIKIIEQLNIKPIELVRTKEKIWIENYKNKALTDDQIVNILIENPKLIERPIVIKNDKAVIARPTDKINEIL